MQLRIERRMIPHVPWGLVGSTLVIALIGIYNLASASRPPQTELHQQVLDQLQRVDFMKAWSNQLLWLGVGLVAMAAIALVDYRFIQRAAVPLYVINILMLLALKLIGHKAKGAESWFALGPFRLQPAEFTKIAVVMMLAKFFHDTYRPNHPGYGFLGLAAPAAIAFLPMALVLAQPDLGTAMMLFFTSLTVMLFAKVRWWVWAMLGVGLLAGALVIWNDWVREQPEPRVTVVRHFLKRHQDSRISGWLNPEQDPRGVNYHAIQSKIAVGSGELFGKGWMKGTQTGLSFLPEQHTDFIFSVWAEEHGFVACLTLLALYGFLFLATLEVAFNARDRFGAFVAVGVCAMLFWQVFENIGMVTGLLPVTGITLPLMSYGGSSMLSVMIGIGLLVNISMRRHIF